MQMNLKPTLWSPALQFGIFATLFTLAALISAQSFWTESEVWATTVVKYLFTNANDYNFNVKPLTNFLLYLSFILARLLDVHPMDTARLLYGVNFLFMIFLCFALIRRHSPAARWTALLMLLFISNSFLLKRGAQVRSDLMMSSVLLLWLNLCESPQTKTWSRRTELLAFGLLSAVAMSITPKSGLFILALFTTQFCTPRWRLGILLLAGAATASIFIWPQTISSIAPLRFFVASSFSGPGSLDYFSWLRLWHVNHFLLQNPIFPLIWLRNLWAGLFDRNGRSRQALLLIDFANITFAIFIVFPDRLPFFIASLVPFWLIALRDLPSDKWCRLLILKLSPAFRKRATVVAVVLGLSNFALWESHLLFQHNADSHHAYVKWIRQFEPQFARLNVYDPAGVIPFLPVNHWFLGPGEQHNEDVVRRILAKRPDVIITSDKLFLVGNELKKIVLEEYYWDGAGLLIHRQVIHPPERPQLSGSEILTHLRPFILDKNGEPLPEFVLELRANNDLDLSRYAKWKDRQGERPFNSHVKLSDLDSDLLVPRGAAHWVIYPMKISTPYSFRWAELFRFDTDN